MFLAVDHSPREVIWEKMLPEVEETRKRIVQYVTRSSAYEGGRGYWDDYCLVHFLEGVCLRFIAYPVRSHFFFCVLHFLLTKLIGQRGYCP